jgi:hypothetical protein
MTKRENPGASGVIIALGVAAAGYLVYQWLQSSGLWAQWFGGATAGNTFSTPATLLGYCQANPNGTAIYQAVGGAPTSAPCSQWLAAQTPVASATPVASPGGAGGAAMPVSVPLPVTSSPSSTGLVIPSNLTVSPNINNSLSGNVMINGTSTNLSIITANLGQSAGLIYNTAGQDITNQFSTDEQQGLVSAFLSANGGLAGLGWMSSTETPYGWEM